MENLNEFIEINLNLLYKADDNKMYSTDFLNINGDRLTAKYLGLEYQVELEDEGLIRTNETLCKITPKGFEIAKNGGWKKYLAEENIANEIANEQKLIKDKLELDLAKSNLEANKLNKKIAKQNEKNEKNNKIATWVNIGIGLINIGLLLWQILKGK
ncbi:hypothetical protein [Flavobacterium sp.]|uniref:hypothetical protein n=1 Tax=Flavobacterium sp. TaxID=239 RepID=UPI0037504A22